MISYEYIENDLNTFDLGRKLNRIIGTEVWEIILDTFAKLRDDAQADVFRLPPGDPNVMAAHAAASSLTQAYAHFKEGIEAAGEFANNPSEELKKYLRQAVDATDVVKQMEKK